MAKLLLLVIGLMDDFDEWASLAVGRSSARAEPLSGSGEVVPLAIHDAELSEALAICEVPARLSFKRNSHEHISHARSGKRLKVEQTKNAQLVESHAAEDLELAISEYVHGNVSSSKAASVLNTEQRAIVELHVALRPPHPRQWQ